jgi:hypothetical protein
MLFPELLESASFYDAHEWQEVLSITPPGVRGLLPEAYAAVAMATAITDCHEHREALSSCCAAFHRLRAAVFRRAAS